LFSSELQVGIAYALLAGVLWGIGPLLLKRALKYTNVSTATLVEQNVSVVLIVGLAIYYGEIGQIDFASRAFCILPGRRCRREFRQGFLL
jgi:uncharacterized membrane protein